MRSFLGEFWIREKDDWLIERDSREVLLHPERLMMNIMVVGVVGEQELYAQRTNERIEGQLLLSSLCASLQERERRLTCIGSHQILYPE